MDIFRPSDKLGKQAENIVLSDFVGKRQLSENAEICSENFKCFSKITKVRKKVLANGPKIGQKLGFWQFISVQFIGLVVKALRRNYLAQLGPPQAHDHHQEWNLWLNLGQVFKSSTSAGSVCNNITH